MRDARSLLRRIKRPCADLVDGNLVIVEIPQSHVHVSVPPEPRSGPCVESERRKLAGQLCVAGREELHFMERLPIPRGPGQQRQQQTDSHQQAGARELNPIDWPAPFRRQNQTSSDKQQRRFWANQSAESSHEPSQKPWTECARRAGRRVRPLTRVPLGLK